MEKEMSSMIENIEGFRLPRYEQIPNVGLYLEQVVRYVNAHLAPLGESELTSSMVSNYVKQGLIPSPIKKAYTELESVRRSPMQRIFFAARSWPPSTRFIWIDTWRIIKSGGKRRFTDRNRNRCRALYSYGHLTHARGYCLLYEFICL